ncbi:MAG: hypothetical protein WCK65_04005 [Rhodospirillaceae bacterium]
MPPTVNDMTLVPATTVLAALGVALSISAAALLAWVMVMAPVSSR